MAVTVEAVAQIGEVGHGIVLTASAVPTKTPDQREGLIRPVMEGHLRGIIRTTDGRRIVKQPEMVSDRMRSTCADDMNKMGLSNFIHNQGSPRQERSTSPTWDADVARIKRDADVATAEPIVIPPSGARRSAIGSSQAQADQGSVRPGPFPGQAGRSATGPRN